MIAAAPAVLVRAIPGDELQRAAGERELGVIEHGEERAQPRPCHAGGRLGRRRQLCGPALLAPEAP
jgi:hypothetical protein